MSDYKPDAAEAERLLSDPIFKWAFDHFRQTILAQLESAPIRDREGREYLCDLLKAGKGLRDSIEHVVREGKIKDFQANKKPSSFLGDLRSGD